MFSGSEAQQNKGAAAGIVMPEAFTNPMLTETEYRRVLVEWNNTRSAYPQDRCVHELVEIQAERSPDAVAVEQGSRRLTYRELNGRANRLAEKLVDLGVRPEVPVGICLERSPELAVALLGMLKAGGACLPLDPEYPQERLAHMLGDARVPVLLTEEKLLPALPKVDATVVRVTERGFAEESRRNPRTSIQPDNLAYVIYTSGSTGKPRGVLLTHGGLVNHHTAATKLYSLDPTDRVLQFSSLSFDIAIEEIFPTWIAGGAVVLRSQDMPLGGRAFLQWIKEQQITVLNLPTAYWHEWVHELSDVEEALPATLRLVIVGGEKASSAAYAEWRKRTNGRVRWINTYGPSEASVIATAYEPPMSDPGPVPLCLPIGRPIANTQVYLLDQDLSPVPVGVPGELHIGGVGLARGYLNQPEFTALKFIPNPFSPDASARLYKTGDMARYLPNGDIEFLGRTDDQVKIRGFRVELGEVEAALAQHPQVGELVVVAREDTPGDKTLVAYLVARRGPAPTPGGLRGFLEARLPEYMVPSAFVVLDSLPLTPNGKVDRRALPRPTDNGLEVIPAAQAPRDQLEAHLLKMWQTILGRKSIGLRQNFFDLGGHSLLAVRLMHRIELDLDKKHPITALLQYPTIEQLAHYLRNGIESRWSCIVPMQPLGARPPFFCAHGIGGAVLRFRDLARYLGADQPFYGLQAIGLDGKHPCLTRVEDMAVEYLKEVRQVQPEGPYYLGGYSMGGAVALEMARLLLADGQEVGLLALLDTFAGKFQTKSELFAKFVTLPLRDKLYHIERKLREFPASQRRRFASYFMPMALKNVREACYRAALAYVPSNYPGKITFFYATEKSLSSADDPRAAWLPLADGGLEAHQMPGDHGSIVDEPQVRLLAEQLSSCLQRSQSRASSDSRACVVSA